MIAEKQNKWGYPSILLMAVGVSHIGEWVFLIAMNLIIFEMTGSPFAITILYATKPLAAVMTMVWAGSLIDRLNKRRLMIILDASRALLICLLPFISSLGLIYMMIFIINMGSAIFQPVSLTYITKLIPKERRKRFNSLYSLMTSGAFLIGPALAGVMFVLGDLYLAIFMNAIALLLSAIVTCFLPDPEKGTLNSPISPFSFYELKKDWILVIHFSFSNRYIMSIYFLFSLTMVIMTSAIDSLEAAFAKDVLLLTDDRYGFLVSIAGGGILLGAFITTLVVSYVSTHFLIGFASLFVAFGYLIYATSSSLPMAGVGFFIIGFFIAFANTGFLTFFQNNIPVKAMGRIGSAYSFIEATLTVAATLMIGVSASIFSLQTVVIYGSITMLTFALSLCVINMLPIKSLKKASS
ncbi:MFS transporter [Bacillus sp. A301a_S52]|nr:MFS transporter [Bacillus sp. A301a_S52]